MSSALFGLACLLFFAVTQAVRDSFFGNVFQSVSFLVVAILAFGVSTVVFGAWAWLRKPEEVRELIGNTRLFLALNVTTAAAWMAYFFALKNVEPAIVSTLYTGIGQIAVLVLSVFGVSMAKEADTGWLERVGYFGVVVSLSAIGAVAVFGQSGLGGQPMSIRIAAVMAATVGGVLITISHMIARRFGDLGIGSIALMGLRFPITLGVAVVAELALGQPHSRPDLGALPVLAFAAFALQQFDGRLRFSGATLSCILAFVFFATLTSALRAWAEANRR